MGESYARQYQVPFFPGQWRETYNRGTDIIRYYLLQNFASVRFCAVEKYQVGLKIYKGYSIDILYFLNKKQSIYDL